MFKLKFIESLIYPYTLKKPYVPIALAIVLLGPLVIVGYQLLRMHQIH